MSDTVEEVAEGDRPVINYNAVKVYDERNRCLYIYGGTRWPVNDNIRSPTCKPTSDFFRFSFGSVHPWTNYTNDMRDDRSLISPFEETLSVPQTSGLELPGLGPLPTLNNAVGTVVHDNTASMTPYLLLLGEPVRKSSRKESHPELLCINLKQNAWRIIELRNARSVPNGRSRASMIISGTLRTEGVDVYLCVFGGDVNTITSSRKFSVANLSKGIWTIPDGELPEAVGPLGIHPGLAKYWDAHQGRELLLIMRGAVEPHAGSSESAAKATFTKAVLFDVQSSSQCFMDVSIDTLHIPASAKTFIWQRCTSSLPSTSDYVLVTCGHRRGPNTYPLRSAKRASILYIRPKIRVWTAEIVHVNNAVGIEPEHTEDSEIHIDLTSDNESDSSSTESDSPTRVKNCRLSKSLNIFTQRAKRTGPPLLRKSGLKIIWRNVNCGRLKRHLDNLNPSFRVEAMYLSGNLPSRFEQSEYTYGHPFSPKLILLGCDHEFLGEVLGDIHNAFACISLHSLLDTGHDTNSSEEVEEVEDVSVTDDSTLSDNDTLLPHTDESSHSLSPHSSSSTVTVNQSNRAPSDLAELIEVQQALTRKSTELGTPLLMASPALGGRIDPHLCHSFQGEDLFLLPVPKTPTSIDVEDLQVEEIVNKIVGCESDDEMEIDVMLN
ncbi:uncharacterized protein FOMMEDRAFT_157861 [Fomitiporia mediterranea MF3/22]|uniref:uncharacterized protein n=1 Tax=Fomitiporia mediterranea (strain MF3/22) TaxID=694068 RepID=UPI00044078C6|nr:uncharacterized protein FOMMEDRAFT_157861 [Fomitiporia mediterranea MF3/22]EJD00755.1 hypothetical protein FOMMEDRAFT_157861 [Fomitiporia mediterranea MF3/22]